MIPKRRLLRICKYFLSRCYNILNEIANCCRFHYLSDLIDLVFACNSWNCCDVCLQFPPPPRDFCQGHVSNINKRSFSSLAYFIADFTDTYFCEKKLGKSKKSSTTNFWLLAAVDDLEITARAGLLCFLQKLSALKVWKLFLIHHYFFSGLGLYGPRQSNNFVASQPPLHNLVSSPQQMDFQWRKVSRHAFSLIRFLAKLCDFCPALSVLNEISAIQQQWLAIYVLEMAGMFT